MTHSVTTKGYLSNLPLEEDQVNRFKNVRRIIMRSTLRFVTAILIIGIGFATPGWAQRFFFSTGNPDGKLGALTQPASTGKLETETADDFVLLETTAISRAVITGIIVPSTTPLGNISQVEVELYHIFPQDSDTTRNPQVNTRVNSPSDVEIGAATRDSLAGTLSFSPNLLSGSFEVANSVVNGINKAPNQH